MKGWMIGAVALAIAGCGGGDETEAEAKEQPELPTEIDSNQVVGKWTTSRGIESTIIIYEAGSELRMLESFEDGSDLDSLLYQNTVNGETQYAADYGREIGEYYVIGDDGRLQMWSDNGNYYTAPVDD